MWVTKEDGGTDWRELSDALPYVRAWAVTSMSARRFPTDPGLFDLVIIDEAGQCTIPSIVPLLFRAKRALVIGDPMQLAHICTVDTGTDAVLRARFGVPQPWLAEHRLSNHKLLLSRQSGRRQLRGPCGAVRGRLVRGPGVQS